LKIEDGRIDRIKRLDGRLKMEVIILKMKDGRLNIEY